MRRGCRSASSRGWAPGLGLPRGCSESPPLSAPAAPRAPAQGHPISTASAVSPGTQTGTQDSWLDVARRLLSTGRWLLSPRAPPRARRPHPAGRRLCENPCLNLLRLGNTPCSRGGIYRHVGRLVGDQVVSSNDALTSGGRMVGARVPREASLSEAAPHNRRRDRPGEGLGVSSRILFTLF